jgi:hypothetical protein
MERRGREIPKQTPLKYRDFRFAQIPIHRNADGGIPGSSLFRLTPEPKPLLIEGIGTGVSRYNK